MKIASGPAGATLAGTVTVTVSGGIATFSNLSIATPGTYTLSVTSSTTVTLGTAVSNSFVISAPSTTTTTQVTSSINPSTYGQGVSFTAVVSPASGTPTGTVQFTVDGSNYGTPVTLVSGRATGATLSTLGVGTHVVTAVYTGGGTSFQNSTGTLTGGQVVNKAALTVTANNASKVYGQSNPTFTATVPGFVNGGGASVVSGTASLTTTATAASGVGTYTITAGLGTHANYSFTLVNGSLTVTRAALTITANNATKVYGARCRLSDSYVGFVNGDTTAQSDHATHAEHHGHRRQPGRQLYDHGSRGG